MTTMLEQNAIRDLSIVRPWVLRSALSLGLFRRLADHALARDELAQRLGADPEIIRAVTEYLRALGYLTTDDAGSVTLTDSGRVLADLPADAFAAQAPTTIFDRVASELPSAWSEGGPVASRRELPFWEEVAMTPDAARLCGQFQPPTLHFDGPELVDYLGTVASPNDALLDLGGANGALVRDLAPRHRGRLGVLDLPEMIPNARSNLSELPGREFVLHAQSFFEPLPSDYDVYVLNAILYDYTDERVVELLKNVRSSMSPDTVLVISELTTMFQDDTMNAEAALLLTLNTGGRARTPRQVTALAATAGLEQRADIQRSTGRFSLAFDR